MATYIKGDAVENATSYELLENVDGTYNSLATAEEINFEVSALGLGSGDHTLVVQAHADGYDSSDYSNEVIYTVEGESSDETYYTVTYEYVDSEGTSLETSTTESVVAGTVKTFSVDDAPSINGYTISSVEPISATVNSDITVTYTYAVSEDSGNEDDVVILNVWDSGVEPTLTKCTYEKDSEKITLTTDDTVTKWYQAAAKYYISGLVSGETYILQATIDDSLMTAYDNGEINLCTYALSTASTTNIIATTQLAGYLGLEPREFVADAESATLVVYPLNTSSETFTGVSAVFQNFVITKKSS